MRYILYVNTLLEADILKLAPVEIKQHTLIQLKSQIKVPEWLESLPTPVFVDSHVFQAMYGTEIQIFFQSKQKKSFLTKVDDLE